MEFADDIALVLFIQPHAGQEFTYLGSAVSTREGSEQDVEARLENPEQFSGRWINKWKGN